MGQLTERDTLVTARQELVHATVQQSISQLTSHRQAPRVKFTDPSRGVSSGRFQAKPNQIAIRVRGFLDDPTVSDEVIRATVAHECGHWADPDLDARSKRARIYVAPMFIVLAAAMVIIVLSSPAFNTGNPTMAPLALFSGVLATTLSLVGASRCYWPGEYHADQAAAQVVGVPAVIAMLRTFPDSKMPTPTHPTPNARIQRCQSAT